MGTLSWPEILIIALVVVLLFGARRIPEIGKGIGEGIRSFRSALKGDDGSGNTKESGGGSGGAER
jgi:sec-independent protein translocase protein TatA